MAESSMGIPERTGDLAELGLTERKPLILPADDEVEEAPEPQEAVPAEEPVEEVKEEKEEEPSFSLEEYTKSLQPKDEKDEASRLRDLEKQIARLEAQNEELLRSRDREIAAKADEAGKGEEDLDLTSDVLLKYLAETEDPVERERLRMRMLQEKLQDITSKQYGTVQSTLEQTQQRVQQEAASQQFQAQVQNTMKEVAQAGDIERQLVEQWENTPREQRRNTLIGQKLARSPMVAFSSEALTYLIRGLARDIEGQMKSGTVRQPVTETTGAASKASSRSRELTKKPTEELTEEQKFWQKVKGLGSLGEDLDWMK